MILTTDMSKGINWSSMIIEIKSYFDPTHPEQCSAYKDDEYFECVDEEAQKVFYPKLGCNPPWISPNNQCIGILYGEDKRKFINEKLFNTKVNGVWISENKIHHHMKNHKLAPYETNCKRPCNVTTSYVKLKDDRADTTRLKLTFRSEVQYRSKELAYGFFDFLVDIGGALGLWLGLSVYGLAEAFADGIDFAGKADPRNLFK